MEQDRKSARAFAAMGLLIAFAVVGIALIYTLVSDYTDVGYAALIVSLIWLSAAWFKASKVYALTIPSAMDTFLTGPVNPLELTDEEREALMPIYDLDQETLFDDVEPWDLPKEWLDRENKRDKYKSD